MKQEGPDKSVEAEGTNKSAEGPTRSGDEKARSTDSAQSATEAETKNSDQQGAVSPDAMATSREANGLTPQAVMQQHGAGGGTGGGAATPDLSSVASPMVAIGNLGSGGQRSQGGAGQQNADRERSGGGLEITSQTALQAIDGTPDSRRMVGVGEWVTFTSSSPGTWSGPGIEDSSRSRSQSVQLTEPGRHEISVQTAGGQSASISIRVVEPSINVAKVGEHDLDNGMLGVHMELRFQLTPMNVSFNMLEVQERSCPPGAVWGYFAEHNDTFGPYMEHDPAASHVTGQSSAGWAAVQAGNKLNRTDHAALALPRNTLIMPLTPGGFRWQIPDVYRINSQIERSFQRPMTQAYRVDEQGTVTVWKGGQSASRPAPSAIRNTLNR